MNNKSCYQLELIYCDMRQFLPVLGLSIFSLNCFQATCQIDSISMEVNGVQLSLVKGTSTYMDYKLPKVENDTVEIPPLIQLAVGSMNFDAYGTELYSYSEQDTTEFIVPNQSVVIKENYVSITIRIKDSIIRPHSIDALLIQKKRNKTGVVECLALCPNIDEDKALYLKTARFRYKGESYTVELNLLIRK